MFNEVLDKVISRAQSWNAKILSQASRITLVKSVLASIPTYTSSTFYLSKNICSKIDVLRNLLGVTLRTRILFSQCPGPRFVSPKIVHLYIYIYIYSHQQNSFHAQFEEYQPTSSLHQILISSYTFCGHKFTNYYFVFVDFQTISLPYLSHLLNVFLLYGIHTQLHII